ncbi:hypothetical protein [Piscirickettsia litoralis]|uniref:Uncharacterized protein n=1 Tax=Piscirickettsia litoralis TaxID=1891921 RepID=A0ABX2ZZ17_9GAMM|nr:hypothetical protein [Piscirickettsia litoralis]ODN41257.1 hypothetical protein BGC07_16935 [Piscirickettsia litoralis]
MKIKNKVEKLAQWKETSLSLFNEIIANLYPKDDDMQSAKAYWQRYKLYRYADVILKAIVKKMPIWERTKSQYLPKAVNFLKSQDWRIYVPRQQRLVDTSQISTKTAKVTNPLSQSYYHEQQEIYGLSSNTSSEYEEDQIADVSNSIFSAQSSSSHSSSNSETSYENINSETTIISNQVMGTQPPSTEIKGEQGKHHQNFCAKDDISPETIKSEKNRLENSTTLEPYTPNGLTHILKRELSVLC